jgi:uncharacterized protein (TIGR00369 family)
MNYEPKNPDFYNNIKAKFAKNVFSHHIGFSLTRIEPGLVEGELEMGDIHLQQSSRLHGGVTSTVADIVMGFAAYSLVADNEATVTSDLKISYLRAGMGERLIARGKVIKPGKLLYYCEADILTVDALGTEVLIARGYATMCAVSLEK